MYDIIIEVRLEKYEINTRHRNVDTRMFLIFSVLINSGVYIFNDKI